jgi:hypothetical protein
MDGVRSGRSGEVWRRTYIGCLLVLTAALLLIWTAEAPALTQITLDIQVRPTFYVGEHSLALKSDGSLWAWGINGDGAVGDGSTAEHLAPVRIGTDTDWVTVAGGSGVSLALKSDGTLWTWGSNQYGQLGDGATIERHVPTRIGTDTDWATVAGGFDHCLALKSDGTLWAWGNNIRGELGDGTTIERHVPTRIGTDTDWVTVAGGSGFSLALRSDGTLWAWGSNQYGQLGDGTTARRHVPTRAGTDTDWVAVAGGSDHSLALKSDGTLWAWGNNVKGELGDGTTVDRHIPTRVGTETTWMCAGGGGFGGTNGGVSMGLQSDGSLLAWGYGRHGEVGDGLRANRLTPVVVLQAVRLPASGDGRSAFSDVAVTDPYYQAISAMARAGALGGYPDGTFRPDNLVTRQHFAKMIVGAMGLPVAEDDWQDTTPPFTDCGPDDLANLYPHDYIAVAKARNLTSGKTATTFAPRANITRAQMATMVVRAAKGSGMELAAVDADYAGPLIDYGDPIHGINVQLADRNGLLQGLVVAGDPSAWIAGNATRGEVAQVLSNLMRLRAD